MEESRARTRDIHRSLYLHRIQVVRVEARGTHLIRGYARWLVDPSWSYSKLEANPDPHCYFRRLAFTRAVKMAKNFGIDPSRFEEWVME